MVSSSSEELCYCSWCFKKIFEDRECFLLQMKCMMSASVEVIFYWAWLIILVWENEPKLKETTVNYFVLRYHWWVEEYTRENSESIKKICQNHRDFSYISSLSCLVWLRAPWFFPNVSTSSKKCGKLKRKLIFNSCLNLLLFFHFFSFVYSCWKYMASFWDFFCYLIR